MNALRQTMLPMVMLMASLALAACGGGSSGATSTDNPATSTDNPATEHHPTDNVAAGTSGTTSVTLGGLPFTTSQRDLSGVAQDMTAKTVNAVKDTEYAINGNLDQFRIEGDNVIGVISESAFVQHMIVYSMAQTKNLSQKEPDTYITGFDFNGAIMLVDGSEDVDFYKVDSGSIGEHFFQLKEYQGSKFLSECYLDHDMGYVFNSDEILQFPLSDIKTVKSLAVPAFATIRFSSDESYLYVSVWDQSDSSIKVVEKGSFAVTAEIPLYGVHVRGLTVDANYIYAADEDTGIVHVLNKHTYADAGTINIPNVGRIDIVDDALYAFNKTTQKLEKWTVSFQ